MPTTIGWPRTNRGRLAILGPAIVALVALASAAAGPGAARDAFIAGQLGTTVMRLSAADQAHAAERASLVRRALALPDGARATVVRLQDRFEGALIDEITSLDAMGRPLAIVRLDATGGLRTAVRLGWSATAGALSEAHAREAAERVVRASGLPARSSGVATVTRSAHGWFVGWPRLAAGSPVRGDGTWVRLWSDGTLHSVARVESPLAAVPGDPISAADALAIVHATMHEWGLTEATASDPVLAWVAPNDLFEPAKPDAPDAVRRLAWVIRVTPGGDVSSRLRAVEIHVDASDGRLIGGDVLE